MLHQVEAIIGVVAMISVKTTMLVPISLLRRGSDPLGTLDGWGIFDIQEHLLHGCIEWSIVLKPTQENVDPGPDPVVVVAFSRPTTSLFLRCLLLLPLYLIRLLTRPNILLSSGVEGVLNIHMSLCLYHEVGHAGWEILEREKRNLEGSSPAMREATITFSSTLSLVLLDVQQIGGWLPMSLAA